MKAQTTGWVVVLLLTQTGCFAYSILFTAKPDQLSAQEGSCAKMECSVTATVDAAGAYWFWMKDRVWNNNDWNYKAIVYSTNDSLHAASPDFVKRVTYEGNLSSGRNYKSTNKKCGILLCDLKKTDIGNYSFRFVGSEKWTTDEVSLRVTDNFCPITFNNVPVANESQVITITCSTSSTCRSSLQISGERSRFLWHTDTQGKQKSIWGTISTTWQDDGMELSCQTDRNNDKYLIRKIRLTVEYAPNVANVTINPTDIVEGRHAILTCSANGNPVPTFTWFKNKTLVLSGPQLEFASINPSEDGIYHCEARNKLGATTSQPAVVNVQYKPEVELKLLSPVHEVREGDNLKLLCSVKRSNPTPLSYTWVKDSEVLNQHESIYTKKAEPGDKGSYMCKATNRQGTGASASLHIHVKYRPRLTRITNNSDGKVKVGHSLTLFCSADANPPPFEYLWYHYNKDQSESSQWKKKTQANSLRFDKIQRADDGCYVCSATNAIDMGMNSTQACVEVLYPPTNLKLSVVTEVKEGHLLVIRCTVESFPWSELTLLRMAPSSSSSSRSELQFQPRQYQQPNTLQYSVNATPANEGSYICYAKNSEGSSETLKSHLAVKYTPKNVTVLAKPGLIVSENASLTLSCSAKSYPAVTSVTWTKVVNGVAKVVRRESTLRLNPVGFSDSGLYSCSAENQMGTGNSQEAEVRVKHSPRHTQIRILSEQQQPDKRRSVTLSCSGICYPPARHYSWYKKANRKGKDVKVSENQNHTVYSDEPGIYYCSAKNELGEGLSDPVPLFVSGYLMTILKFSSLFLLLLLLIFLLFFVYRHKRKKSVQQNTNTPQCFLIGRTCEQRRMMNEAMITEPSRSREDLLYDQSCKPKAWRRQPGPGSTPASNINSDYCSVNLPVATEGPSGGQTEDGSLNYAALQFGNKQKNQKAKTEENVVYAAVAKEKPPKSETKGQEDYENIRSMEIADAWVSDTDSSDDEVQLCYTQVNFTAKSGHPKADSDSSTSDEEETQYSEIKT